jgi:mono/diheme cytochrome c family protein
MNCLPRSQLARFVLPTALLLTAVVVTNKCAVSGPATKPDESKIKHGKYLVHHVAHCDQCHTPRDHRGSLIQSLLLTGARIPVEGPKFSSPWAAESVSLAGLVNYDVSFVRHLMTQGARPDGTHPKPPMPSFRLSAEDADAVIEYLKSLK